MESDRDSVGCKLPSKDGMMVLAEKLPCAGGRS